MRNVNLLSCVIQFRAGRLSINFNREKLHTYIQNTRALEVYIVYAPNKKITTQTVKPQSRPKFSHKVATNSPRKRKKPSCTRSLFAFKFSTQTSTLNPPNPTAHTRPENHSLPRTNMLWAQKSIIFHIFISSIPFNPFSARRLPCQHRHNQPDRGAGKANRREHAYNTAVHIQTPSSTFFSPHIKDRDKPEKKELEYAWLCVRGFMHFWIPLAVSCCPDHRRFPDNSRKSPKEGPSSNAITLKKSPFSCLVPFFFSVRKTDCWWSFSVLNVFSPRLDALIARERARKNITLRDKGSVGCFLLGDTLDRWTPQ